jgi:hypothetical protein
LFIEITYRLEGGLSFISHNRQRILMKKLPIRGAISKAINLIAGRLLFSRAYFPFRFIT